MTTQLGEAGALQCPPGLQPAGRLRVEDTVAPFVQDWVFGWEQVRHDEAICKCCEVHWFTAWTARGMACDAPLLAL